MHYFTGRRVACRYGLAGVLIALSYALAAQPSVPIGTWRTHFSYRNVQHLAVTPERVYGAAANGLFYLSLSDNSLQLLSKNDGLSDVSVTALAYEPSLDALMLAYQSSRIDVLIRNQVVPFTLLQQASQDQREVIYDIHWAGTTAFVGTSQGVRVLAVETSETPTVRIQESYTRLSATGDPLAIFSVTTSADSIFLASEAGVIANALNPAVNKQDFNTWHRFGLAQGLPEADVRHIIHQNETTYAAFDGAGLFRYQAGNWQPTALATTQSFHALRTTSSALIAVLDNQVAILDEQEVTNISHALLVAPQDAVVDEQGGLWIADRDNGLVRRHNDFTSFFPNGPASDDLSDVRFVNQRVVALSSGTFSVFTEGRWTTYPTVPTDARLLDIAFSPATRAYYLASFGNGLVQWDGDQTFTVVPPPTGDATNYSLTSLAMQDEQLWVSRFGTANTLLSFLPDEGTWRDFSTVNAAYPRQVTVDFSGYKWLLVGDPSDPEQPGTDVLIFDEQENQVQSVRQHVRSEELPGDQLTDLVVDRDGLVWVGGSRGIAYFPNPFGIFSEVVLVKPVFDRQFLLRDEYVTSLAVDGGNRKWVGTRNGLWLFSETGEELIHHFTTANSPLVSNSIRDIAINDTDGEVFIATDRGLVSYRGTATEGSPVHQSVKVFPNPVRSGFDGTVGIQGLASDATVKITTISGTLVQELQAQGGTATWDVRSYAGQRVSAGVYLLFSATADGEETYVGKLAVIP